MSDHADEIAREIAMRHGPGGHAREVLADAIAAALRAYGDERAEAVVDRAIAAGWTAPDLHKAIRSLKSVQPDTGNGS